MPDSGTARYSGVAGLSSAPIQSSYEDAELLGRIEVQAEFARRADDNEVALRTRLMEYYKKTSPLIGYYYAKGNLSSIDGLAEMDVVAASLGSVLDTGK